MEGGVMTDDQLIESLRARTWPGDCEAAAFRLEELRARVAELEALPGNVLAQRVENLEAQLKVLREQDPVGIVDEDDDGVFADLETTNGVIVKLGCKLYALPAPARELTDADIGRCIASADRSFEQEPISGSPVLGVWSRHLARAIERHMRGEGE